MKGKGKQIILIICAQLLCPKPFTYEGTYVIDNFYGPTPLNTTNKM